MGEAKDTNDLAPPEAVDTTAAAIAEPADAGATEPSTSEEALGRLVRIVESVLFASGAPLSLKRLAEILDGPPLKEILAAVLQLKKEYAEGARGIQLHEVAGGYQLRTARENAEWVRALFREKPARLGRAALETLSVIAYKQPVTKTDIEAIRGVDVDGTLATLMARRLIKIAGRKEAVGRPLLYATSGEFLEAFQLKDLQDLPSLKELGPAPESESYDSDALIDTAPAGEVGNPEDESVAAAESFGSETVVAAAVEAEASTAAADHASDAPGGEGTTAPDERTAAEDSEPGRDRIAPAGGADDSRRAGARQRSRRHRAGDEGESAQ